MTSAGQRVLVTVTCVSSGPEAFLSGQDPQESFLPLPCDPWLWRQCLLHRPASQRHLQRERNRPSLPQLLGFGGVSSRGTV